MPRYKPIRARRYEDLRKSGFLSQEASILSKVPGYVPYLKELKHDRKSILNRAIKNNYTNAQYRKEIADLYDKNNWSEYAVIANQRLLRIDASAVYKMLREYEDKWKDEHGTQAFKSPWVKKQRDYVAFSRKFDNMNKMFHD